MTVIQLDHNYQKSLKRALREQCAVGSAHLTEAIARGCGYQTQAALLAALNGEMAGYYIRFDEAVFRHRLLEVSSTPAPDLIALPSLGHSARYVAGLFDDPAIVIVSFCNTRARFRLTGINTVIEIDLTDIGNGYTQFERSHAIHTPTQAGPYWPSRDFDDDPAYAMHRAIESFVHYYRDAVRAGHTPDADWLISSPY